MNKIAVKKMIGVILLIIIFVVVGYFVWLTSMLIHTDLWKYNADFAEHKESFEIVKEYILDEVYCDGKVLSLSYSEFYFFDLYDHSRQRYLECPEEIRNALEDISREAFYFKDSQFNMIRCQDGLVEFCIANGQYMLVYSPNGNPRSIIKEGMSNDQYTLKCKKVEKGWYHVRIMNS